jgi:hypothetical protein
LFHDVPPRPITACPTWGYLRGYGPPYPRGYGYRSVAGKLTDATIKAAKSKSPNLGTGSMLFDRGGMFLYQAERRSVLAYEVPARWTGVIDMRLSHT